MSKEVKEENQVEAFDLDTFGTVGATINVDAVREELEVSSFPKEFFTINNDTNLVLTTHLLTDGAYNSYLVASAIAGMLGNDVKRRNLLAAQTASGENFLLSVAAPTAMNSSNSWVRSGQEAVKQGMNGYIRVTKNDDSFRIIKPQRPYPKTIWPELSLEDMIEQAFGERMITDMEHPLVKELLGLK